jgi:hypothetical protein
MAMDWMEVMRLHEAIGYMDDAEHYAVEVAHGR